MSLNVGREVAALRRMTVPELRGHYAQVFGETTGASNKDWLCKRIAWRLQATAEGGLSERARRRAAELANDADLRLSPPRAAASVAAPAPATVALPDHDRRLPPPGTVLTRTYKGVMLHVKVLPKGFEHEGTVYRSLSAVAKSITGSHCNGYLFFQLSTKGGER